MPTLSLNIDAGALSQLSELPEQVLAAVATARQALDGANSSDSGNAVGALLNGLGTLPDQLGTLPDLGDALGGLSGLRELLPADLTTGGAAVLDALGTLTGLFGPIAALIDGDPGAAIAAAVDQLGGLAATIGERSESAIGVTTELQEFFRLLASLDDWATAAPPATEVAGLIAKAFIGADLEILVGPVAALNRCLAGLDGVLPDGADLGRWRTGLSGLNAIWSGFEARVSGPTIDWLALELDLQAASRAQAELIAIRDQLIAGAVSALGGLDLSGLVSVAAALKAVPELPEVRLTPILDGFVAQLRSLRDGLEHWELTPDDARRVVRGLVQRLLAAIDQSAIGEIRRWLLSLEQRVLALIEGLPLRVIADEITDALDSIAGAIDDIDLSGLLAPITTLGDTVGAAIADLGGDAVRNTVGQVWDSVEVALGEAATILEQLRDALDTVTGPVTEFAARVGPAVTAITDLLTDVRVALDAFDLAQPTAAVLDILHRARDTVAAIDVSLLPAAAVQLVHDAAGALADIDIAGSVNGPIVEVLDAVDPGPALEAAVGVLADVATQLAAIDPTQLIATLDEPVTTVLEGLAELDPTQLRALVDDALAPVRDAIGVLDATEVLAPATQAFADVIAKLDSVLDPTPIFAPLQTAYQPIIDVVEALDPAALLDLIAPHAEGMTGSFGGAAGATLGPASVTGGSAGFTSLASSVDASDDLFGFRPGDMLVPVIDLHHRLMGAVEGLTAGLLDDAAVALHSAFGGSLAALRPDAILDRIDGALSRVQAELGVIATTTAVADGALAYQRVAAKLSFGARSASGPDITVSVRVTASLPALDPLRLVAGAGQAASIAASATVARGRADLGALRSAYAVGVARLDRLLPAFLGDGLNGAGLVGALRALDPAPIRDEVNALFDEAGQFLAGLGDVVAAAMEEIAEAAEELLLPLNPSGLLGLVSRIHAGVLAQVQSLAPATLAEHVRLVFAAVRHQLEALDPAQLAEQVDAVREGLLAALDDLVDGLLPDPAPLHDLQQRLEQLRPSQLLAPVIVALRPITELAASVDADALVQPLLDAVERVRSQVPDVIAQLEEAFDEVLRAFPEGGVSSVSGSVSVG